MISHEWMKQAVEILGGISIEQLHSGGFHSEIVDHLEAIRSIIKRHPMNQFEIEGFLMTRGCTDCSNILEKLRGSEDILVTDYKGYVSFRLK